jgi:uncharacterized membrane protein YeaQ/YmgE (transglycosylase-associated protein family)
MDFLKEAGIPNVGVILMGILGIIVIGTIVATLGYLFNHPLVLVLVLAAIGALAYLYIRHKRNKNKV